MMNEKTSSEENASVVITPKSEIANALERGDIDAALNAMSSDPEAIAQFVESTEIALKEGKEKAVVIRDRGFFKKLFSSPSSDLAKLLLEQNDVMTRFFVMLQLLTLQSEGNAKYLADICTAIKKASDTGDAEEGNLQRIAVTFLEQNIETKKAEKVRDLALMKLLKAAELNAVFESEMRGAEEKAEKKYLDSSNKLKREYESLQNTVKAELDSFRADLAQKAATDAFEEFKKSIHTDMNSKATIESMNDGIGNLGNKLSKIIESTVSKFEMENYKLNRQFIISLIIGGFGLFVAIATLIISLLGLI